MEDHDESRHDRHRDQLERELVHRYRARRVREPRGNLFMAMQMKSVRWAAVAVVLVLGAVACTTPTSTEMEMGKQIQFTLPAELAASDSYAEVTRLVANTKQILQELSDRGIESVNVGFRETTDGGVTVELALWGEDIDADRTIRRLTERYTALREADVDVRALHTEVTEPLYAKLSREVLHIEVGGESDDEIRARILAELAAKGFDGSTVDVRTEGGLTTIDMQVEGDGTHDHEMIELIHDGEPVEVDVPVGGDEDGATKVEVEKRRN